MDMIIVILLFALIIGIPYLLLTKLGNKKPLKEQHYMDMWELYNKDRRRELDDLLPMSDDDVKGSLGQYRVLCSKFKN